MSLAMWDYSAPGASPFGSPLQAAVANVSGVQRGQTSALVERKFPQDVATDGSP